MWNKLNWLAVGSTGDSHETSGVITPAAKLSPAYHCLSYVIKVDIIKSKITTQWISVVLLTAVITFLQMCKHCACYVVWIHTDTEMEEIKLYLKQFICSSGGREWSRGRVGYNRLCSCGGHSRNKICEHLQLGRWHQRRVGKPDTGGPHIWHCTNINKLNIAL